MKASRKKTRHARVRLLSLALLAGSLSCRSQVSPQSPAPAAPTGGPVAMSAADATAFEKAAPMPVAQVPGDPLSPADTSKVLSRLKPISAEAGDQQDFALREKSLPPPRTGETIKDHFPPPQKPDVPAAEKAGPVEISRYAPEGEVKLAPQINVTFNQPMIEVTSHDDLAKLGVPVTIKPMPPGKWRWVGTKTALFEPMTDQGGKIGATTVPQATRFQMATVFTVEVPAGTKSAVGGTLEKAKRWTFSTPAPTLTGSSPNGGPQILDPLMYATFDQRIDPAAVLKTIRVLVPGHKPLEGAALHLASAQELKDAGYGSLEESWETKGRWLAFRADKPFPTNTEVSVEIGPGTPSAEGPRKTEKMQGFSFHTYGPMEVIRGECGYGECYAGTPFSFEFTNSIQTTPPPKGQTLAFFDPKTMVKVSPEIPGMKLEASGNYIGISGRTKGHVTYNVTLLAGIPDVYKQTLEKERSFKFTVRPSPPSLTGPQTLFMVLDPSSKAQFPVYSINHKNLRLTVYAVAPSDWPRYTQWLQRRWDEHYKPIEPPGKKVLAKLIPIKGTEDEMSETDMEVGAALHGGFGNAIVIVEQEKPAPANNPWEEQIVMGWVEVTQIGLDAMVDGDDLYGFATNLKDARPIGGIELEVGPDGNHAKTGKDGLAKIPLREASKGSYMLLGKRGQDVAFLPQNPNYWYEGEGWFKRAAGNEARWFVFDDRNMYRPGEEVHFKGYIRSYFGGKGGDVGGNPGATGVKWVLHDSRGNEISKGAAKVNAFGGFDGKLKLPGTMNLGSANLALTADGMTMQGAGTGLSFQVQEFRRPEFEVSAKSSEGPHFSGDKATVSVTANYYAGGGLPNAETTWQVSTSPSSYAPPGWSDFSFGTWVPWWGYYRGGWEEDEGPGRFGYGGGNYQSFQGKTDASGTHTVTLPLSAELTPVSIHAEATVMDVNRQAWSAGTDLLVHPASMYVGMKSDRLFVSKGEPLHIDVIMTDLDGKVVTGRTIAVHAVRLDWSQKQGSWSQDEVDPQDCKPTSGDKPSRCDFKTPEGGTYKVSALIEDDKHRKNRSELTLWVAGGKQPPSRDVKQEQVTLIPNQKEYKAGDTAEILVQAPWWPAEGILSLRRSGIVETRRFTMTGPTTTLKVPIVDGYVPNLYAQVDLVGAAVRMDDQGNVQPKLPKRPAFASGQLDLPVPPRARTLTLTVKPGTDKIEPGATTDLTVDLKDAAGNPVANGEVTVVVVDEAVLALSGYRIGNPLDYFYGGRSPDAQDYHLRASVLLANPLAVKKAQELARMRAHGAGGPNKTTAAPEAPEPAPPPMAEEKEMADDASGAAPGGRGSAPAIKVRSDFDALALFLPEVHTDAAGHAKLTLKVPDNLTRYRIMAVAVYGDKQYGQTESNITARLPLMVRPSAPRFLNFGDRFQLPVVLQNQTDSPMQVDVAVRATNALIMGGEGNTAGRRVTIPANDRVEVRFAAGAVMAGTARFQFGATSGKWQDAAEIKLPVWTPATTEAFATYGEIDKAGAIAQPVKAPSDVYKQFGGLEITTSSTELQSLTDAVVYLATYPYECSEQISSRIMAIASLKDVLTAFKAKGLPAPDELLASMKTDMKRLQGMQGYDGGFGFWQPGDTEWPFLSIHVAHALERAKEKGFDVPEEMLNRSHEYLKQIESHIPSWYPDDVRRALIAYALYVRNRLGDRDVAKARELMRPGLDKLGMESIGWIWPVLSGHDKDDVALIRRYVENRVSEEAGTAHWTTSYGDGEYLLLASDRRVDGILLEDMIVDQPESDLIAKVVRGLLAHRTAGRWESTQESAWVLLGLDKYFNTFEKDTPDFTSRAWLGDRFAGEHVFKGRTTERHHIDIPMAFLAQTVGDQTLTLQKDGPGRLYYRIGMQYAPQNLKLPPSEHGFTVQREYEGVDKKDDVSLDKDGVWHIKAGTKVRVRLTMVAQSRRYHVALVDPIPAGIEAMNPALAVTGSIPQDPKARGNDRYWFWWYPWYEHENLRDERVEAFTSLLWEGVYTYSYLARATTPGNFVVPPAKAEEMYHPETFGRSASDRVIVE